MQEEKEREREFQYFTILFNFMQLALITFIIQSIFYFNFNNNYFVKFKIFYFNLKNC